VGLIISALVAVAGFLGLFHALTSVSYLTCIRADPNMALFSPDMDLLIIIVSLSVSWILGFFQSNASTFQHMGTHFYGREPTEQGYITTKWLVAGFPLLPIRSYIVLYEIADVSIYEYENQRNVMQPFEAYFYFPQMLRTALISYGTIIWCLGCVWLMLNSSCF